MFQRTRLRLTVLNTLIFFLILSMFGAALYFYVKIQLYNKIDASLLAQANNVQLTQNGPGDKLYYPAPDIIDPRVFFITRDLHGSITSKSIDNNSNILISKITRPAHGETKIRTVSMEPVTVVIDGHHYRMLEVNNMNKWDVFPHSLFLRRIEVGSTGYFQSVFGSGIGFERMQSSMSEFSRPFPFDTKGKFEESNVNVDIVDGGPGRTHYIAGATPSLETILDRNRMLREAMINKIQRPLAVTATGTVMPLVTNASSISLTVASPVASMQFISNLDPEINMLHSLFIIIVTGVSVGGLLTLLAGFYLAQRALVPIRESWEKQQQFVADASHELRTPLAVIQANTEILLRHPDHSIEQESGYISTILKESKRINKLITSLLTFARSDSNQMEIQAKPIAMDLLISECVKQFEPLMCLKQIEIKLDLEASLEMHADEERIHQLLVILMDNALKYTPEQGRISISANKSAHAVNLSIEDTGVGIPESDLPFIFERFFRGDKMRSRSDGSMGLGLSIAHWIVDRHGGKIRAESKLGKGTRILLNFPSRK